MLFPRELADALDRPGNAPLREVIDSVDHLARQLLEGAASSTLQASVANIGKAVSALGTPQADRLHGQLAAFEPVGTRPEAYEPLLSLLVHWSTHQCLQAAGMVDPGGESPDCPICTLLARQVMAGFRERCQAADARTRHAWPKGPLAEHALDAIQGGCWEWDLQNQGSRVDARYARLLGHEPPDPGHAMQEHFTSLLHPEDRATFEQRLQVHLEHPDHPCTCVARLRHRDGRWLPMRLTGRVIEWDGAGNPLRMAGLIQTAPPDGPERARGLFTLHDPLTGLPNRLLLIEQLQHELAVAARAGQPVVVVHLAVPDFPALRSAHGHDATDHLLTGLTAAMRETLRETTLMARVDEAGFVLVMRGLSRDHEEAATRRLQAALRLPLAVDDRRRVTMPLAFGLSRHDPARQPRIMAEALLEQAEQALEIAIQAGDGGLHAHDPETDRMARDRRREIERIRAGLSAAEFVLHYQPTVDLRSGAVIALEGLARWQHPELGLLAPARFIPLIEDNPLAIDFGRWEIETALAQIARWNADGLNLSVSVNLSPELVRADSFLDLLKELMARYETVRPGQLVLEIVETVAMEELGELGRLIDRCNRLGVNFCLDDFGTGYSSMNHLKRLAVTTVKIDRSFVGGMLEDADQLATVQSIVRLTETFGRRVSAEGVESELHGRMLLQLGCSLGQGFGIAGPMPAESLEEWLRNWTVPASWMNCSALPPDKLPVLIAEVQHRAWFRDLLQALAGGHAATTPPLNDHECALGRWLHGAQDSGSLAQSEPLLDLEQRHRELHRQAIDAVQAVQRGAAASTEQIEALTRLHQQMLGDLERLRGQ